MIQFLFIITALCYTALILSLVMGFKQVKKSRIRETEIRNRFSIVVPFRNEAANLGNLLDSISILDYPLTHFEVLLVNDHSEDSSDAICKDFSKSHPELSIKVFESNRDSLSPKKDAIEIAIEHAEFEYILTTDADCIVPENWLLAFNEIIIKDHSDLVAGPVGFTTNLDTTRTFTQKFEEIDFLSLQAVGIGSFGIGRPFLCNGANLCYKKSAFVKVNGFEGNETIASGDDVFLLQKFSAKEMILSYLKNAEAIVLTKPQKNMSALISQRLRWASKSTAYKSWFSRFCVFAVFSMNLILALAFLTMLFQNTSWEMVAILFLLKFIIDLFLLYHAAVFFKRFELLKVYVWSSLLYPFFTTYIAIRSMISGYDWKGRSFRK